MRPFLRSKRKFFTILEVLIVIAILLATSSVLGFGIHRAVRDQRFKAESEIIADYLRLAQNLMLIMNADVSVHFKAKDDESAIEMWLSLDQEVYKNNLLKSKINQKKQLFYVRFVDFVDENKTHSDHDRIVVNFISKGSFMSKGIMRLSTNEFKDDKGSLERFICLPGFVKPIVLSSKKTGDIACDEEKQFAFKNKLTSIISQEINDFKETHIPAS